MLGDSQAFSNYPLWIANYGVEAPAVPANNWGGKSWTFWQYSDDGVVPGVNGGAPPVDVNRYRGSRPGMEWYAPQVAHHPLVFTVPGAGTEFDIFALSYQYAWGDF